MRSGKSLTSLLIFVYSAQENSYDRIIVVDSFSKKAVII